MSLGFEPTYKSKGLFTRGGYPLSFTVKLRHHGADNGTWTRTTRFETWHAIPITSYLHMGWRDSRYSLEALTQIPVTMSRLVDLHAMIFPYPQGGNHRTIYRSKLPTSGVEPDLFRCTTCAWLTHQGASSPMYCKFPLARLSLAPWSHTRGIISESWDSNPEPLLPRRSMPPFAPLPDYRR